MDHHLVILIVSLATGLALVAAVVVAGYFTNWFANSSGPPAPLPYSAINVHLTLNGELSKNWSGTFVQNTDLTGVALALTAPSDDADDLDWTPSHSDILKAWSKTDTSSALRLTRTIAIVANTSGVNTESPYVCVLGNTDNHITKYAFGDSDNIFDYSASSSWFSRSLEIVEVQMFQDFKPSGYMSYFGIEADPSASLYFAVASSTSRYESALSGPYYRASNVGELTFRLNQDTTIGIPSTTIFEDDDIISVWANGPGTRYFIIVNNTTGMNVEQPYMVGLTNMQNQVSHFTFGASTDPLVYSDRSDWMYRSTGGNADVYIASS